MFTAVFGLDKAALEKYRDDSSIRLSCSDHEKVDTHPDKIFRGGGPRLAELSASARIKSRENRDKRGDETIKPFFPFVTKWKPTFCR